MPLSNAMFSGITGLDVTSTAISVIGDNIANVNTPGFKERRAEFADILSQTINGTSGFSQVGAGAKTQRISSVFSQGTFESTQKPTDLAIEGRGFFVLEGDKGRFYSRAGLFNFDDEGFLVNPQGMRVQGFGVDPATGLPNTQLGDIQLTQNQAPPRASEQMQVSVNLDSDAAVDNPTIATTFDPSDPNGSAHFQTGVTVYDSLGTAHPVSLYFTQQAAGSDTWTWTATVPPSDTSTAPATPGDPVVVMGQGNLEFDSNGEMTTPASAPSVSFAWAGAATSPQSVDLDFGPVAGTTGVQTTSVASPSTTHSFTQDGFEAGQLRNVIIDPDGFVTGFFSNGETINLHQVALADFANVEGLVAQGDNNLIESRFSGQPLIGGPNAGSLGAIRSSALEQSNVDLAQQFVKLIQHQRAFQANTRTISVTNELLANLVGLGQ